MKTTANSSSNVIRLAAAILAMSNVIPIQAGEVTYPDDSFTSGDTLTASSLNAKFNEIKADVNDNHSRSTALESVKTGYASVSSMAATPFNSSVSYRQCQPQGIVGRALDSGGLSYLDVGIQLPHGATITEITYIAYDIDATYNTTAYFGRESNTHSWLASISTSGTTGMQTVSSGILAIPVDNSTDVFYVRLLSVGTSGCDLVPMKVFVTYTYTN